MPYVIIGYRKGIINEHHYVVNAVNDYNEAVKIAENENWNRDGKYGLGVYIYTPEQKQLLSYFSSNEGENKPKPSIRDFAKNDLGSRALKMNPEDFPTCFKGWLNFWLDIINRSEK